MFTEAEKQYLETHYIARLAVASTLGMPEVITVAYEYDGQNFRLNGDDLKQTSIPEQIKEGNTSVALLVDEVSGYGTAETRGIHIHGVAQITGKRRAVTIWMQPSQYRSWDINGTDDITVGRWHANPANV